MLFKAKMIYNSFAVRFSRRHLLSRCYWFWSYFKGAIFLDQLLSKMWTKCEIEELKWPLWNFWQILEIYKFPNMNIRLWILRLRNSRSWSTCKFLIVVAYVVFMIFTVMYLFNKSGKKNPTSEALRDEDLEQLDLDSKSFFKESLIDYMKLA